VHNYWRYDRYYSGNCEKTIYEGEEQTVYYISGGSGLAAAWVKEDDEASLYYIHTDHLGSIRAITDQSRNIVARYSFDVWGNHRDPGTWQLTDTPDESFTARGFTGHEHISEFGLINMNGRVYDPTTGQFLSPDNYVQMPDYSLGFNRYAYALNNPLKYTDPDGEWVWFIPIGMAVWAGGKVLQQEAQYGNIGQGWGYLGSAMQMGGFMMMGAGIGSFISTAASMGPSWASSGLGGFAYEGLMYSASTYTMAGFGGYEDKALEYSAMALTTFGGRYLANELFGTFKGVEGSGFKNAMAEIGHHAGKGAITGLGVGGAKAIKTGDLNNLWEGALYGGGAGVGLAGFNLMLMGPTYSPSYTPNEEYWGKLEDHGQIYRRGSFLTSEGSGFAWGKNVIYKKAESASIIDNRYWMNHEIGHIIDINRLGEIRFYLKWVYEAIRYGWGFGTLGAHWHRGTLEWQADQYAIDRSGHREFILD
jgi:RHS repeat-associated protein